MQQFDKSRLIAHRGESEDAPENTLPAYRMAVERGFGFECDVYLSLDKRVFTFHDHDLNRTTGGACTKPCSEVTWDEVSRLDVGGWGKWKGSSFSPTRPALLEELLPLARDGRRIYLEIKTGPEIVPYVRDIIAAQSQATPDNLLFITFNRATCRALKDTLPQFKAYWLATFKDWGKNRWRDENTPPDTVEEVVATLRETGADGVDYQFDSGIVTAEFVAGIHAAGFSVHVWTIDSTADARLAFDRGVDTVTTNCAQRLFNESATV